VSSGQINLTLEKQALKCPGSRKPGQIIDITSSTTFPAGLTVVNSIANASDPKAYVTCYNDPAPFLDSAGAMVTTGLLPQCAAVPAPPCVRSQAQDETNVIVTLLIPDGEPKFHVSKK
jgi:hypothetical protein